MPANRGPEWQAIRERIISDRGRVCEHCHLLNPKPLILHHRDIDRLNDSEDNLILLCEKCHEGFHNWRKE